MNKLDTIKKLIWYRGLDKQFPTSGAFMAHLTSGHSAVEVSYIVLSLILKQESAQFDPF